MVMNAMRGGLSGGIFKFIVFGLLAVAVGGLVLMDVGGFFRGGMAGNNVARIGNQTITINELDRNVRRITGQMNLTPGQAYRMGYVDQVLAGDMQARTMDLAARDYGIIPGRGYMARKISKMLSPMVQPGQNAKDVLHQLLISQGSNEKEFLQSVSREAAGNLIVNGIQSGFFDAGDGMAADLNAFSNETRDISYAVFKDSDIKTPAQAKDEDIAKIYEARKEEFAVPEYRTFKLIRLKSSDDAKIAITPQQIKAAYDTNIAQYKTEGGTLYDQALLDTEKDAQKVFEQAQKSHDLKAAVQAVTGKTTAYLGNEDTSQSKTIEAVRKQIEAAKQEGAVLKPIQSPLGWHVIRIQKITPPGARPFNDVKDEIAAELKENAIAEAGYAQTAAIEDRLAAGATPEEVAKDFPVASVALPAMDLRGHDASGKDALAGMDKIKPVILDAGFQLNEGETSTMNQTADGDFIAVNLVKLTPKSYKPLKDVQAVLQKEWLQNQAHIENNNKVQALLERIKSGKAGFDASVKDKIQTIKGLKRDDKKEPFNSQALQALFEAEAHETVTANVKDGVLIAQITAIHLPAAAAKDMAADSEFRKRINASIQNDALLMYLNEKQDRFGSNVNRAMLDQAYGAADQNEKQDQ